MNTFTIIFIAICILTILWLAWHTYIQSLEHGELKAKYSKLVHMTKRIGQPAPQPADPLLLSMCRAGAVMNESRPVPVPVHETKGQPFVNYQAFTPHQAQKLSSNRKQAATQCHGCKGVSIIFSDFPLHGSANCPFCNAKMAF